MAPIVDSEAIRKGLSSGDLFLEFHPTVALDGGRAWGPRRSRDGDGPRVS